MAVVSNRPAGHPPPGMPDYDDLCDDLTYDELTDGMSTCSGSVNDLLDQLVEEDFRDCLDESASILDDLSIPDDTEMPGLKPFSMKKFMINKNLNVNPPSTDRINPQKPVHGAHGALKNGAAEISHTKYGGGAIQEIKHDQGPGTGDFVKMSENSQSKNIVGEFMRVREEKFSSLSGKNSVAPGGKTNSTSSFDVAVTSFTQPNNQQQLNQQQQLYNQQLLKKQHLYQQQQEQLNNIHRQQQEQKQQFTNAGNCSNNGSMNSAYLVQKASNNGIVNSSNIESPVTPNRNSSVANRNSSASNENSSISNGNSSLSNGNSSTSNGNSSYTDRNPRNSSGGNSSQYTINNGARSSVNCTDTAVHSSNPSSARSSVESFINNKPASEYTGSGRTKTCPSPSFDARHLKNAKWSSTEEINYKETSGSFKDIPKVWVPRNQPSPSPDFKPVNFDSNSLKRVKRSVSSDSAYNSPDPKDSFAWKDSTLERKLKDLKKGSLSDAPEPKNRDNDNSLGRTLDNWKSTPLPKVEDPDVLLLKKARQEKKVKQYLEQNFQNRNGKFDDYCPDSEVGALQAKYLDKDGDKPSSPPHTPPPFSKAESRFEREQKIKVGSLDSFTPGGAPRERSLSPPPSASSAQARYERDRFRVQPGRIEDYRPGRCSVNTDKRTDGGCSITKYSSSHSFNPLLSSRSEHNLSINKESGQQSDRHMQRRIKDGYESDSTLSYRKHNYNPTLTPSPKQAKQLYTQVQRGGEVPINGLRMSGSEKDGVPSITVFQSNGEGQDVSSRPGSYSSLGRRDNQRWGDMREHETEEDVKQRQQQQLNQFYSTLSLQKENELKRDQENRKHHDTLLPSQKSPVPLNRYEDQDVNGNQAVYLNAGRKPEDCKMVARALYSFQAQHHRELSFKKGDIIYIKKQVDGNWYEGERNGMVGIFPTTYVNILPSESTVSEEITRSLVRKEKSMEGELGRAKFNFAAQTPMELSLIKGELLTITRRIDKNWFEGRIGSRKGIFPVSYVEVENEENIKPAGTPAAHSILKTGIQPSSSYIPNNMDLSRSIGTMSPYSTLSRPTSSLSGHQDKPQPQPFRAMYNYKPQNEDEVELFEGDVVFVMEKCDDGWFVGTSQRTGIFGTFPGNYVTQV